jgi:hypothetical protein
VKTRLVHAVRHLLRKSPHWTGDIPISQEDTLATRHTVATFAARPGLPGGRGGLAVPSHPSTENGRTGDAQVSQ